jgi:hypothetical protein
VVVTHRHKDHLSGFADDRAADILAGLRPRVVVRPWTEDPDIAPDATEPSRGARSRSFAAGLAGAQEFAAHVERSLEGARGFVRTQLREMAAEQIANRKAVERLEALSEAAEHGGRYVHAGEPSGLEEVLPGVRVSVLGPPTVEQWPAVAGQRADDPEYWIARRGLLERMLDDVEGGSGGLGPEGPDVAELPPGPVRWLLGRMREQRAGSLLRIVRSLDRALNNTSLVLVFEAGRRRLLFPGDAQIENWSYSLHREGAEARRARQALARVDLYKVGHHGSRNATPRSLVALWGEREVTSLLSTMPGVHGHSEATAVPRATLTAALERAGALERTDEAPAGQLFVEVSASMSGDEGFSVSGG